MRRTASWICLFFCVASACGQVSISGKATLTGAVSLTAPASSIPLSPSSTQTLLSYTAPDSSPCTIEVSESATYSPLVHDVDTSLFTASPAVNSDDRAGNITSGTSRQFIIGKRMAEKGSNGKWYSRALQANTVHYYRYTCSDGAHTGSFQTGNIKLGNTYNEPLPADPNAASKPYVAQMGFNGHPEFTKWDITDSTARQETLIDPKTGLLLKRVAMPRDQALGFGADGPFDFTTATGGAWTNPSNVKVDDGSSATYSGSGSDFLYVSDTGYDNTALNQIGGRPTEFLYLQIKAWCSVGSCTSANATLQACLTIDGTTCWPTNATAKFQEIILGTSTSPSLTVIGTGCGVPILDCWTPAGYSPLTRVDLKSSGALGWLIRKKSSSTDQINIQYIRYVQGASLIMDWPASGSANLCSPTLVQNSVTLGLGYHCVLKTNGLDMLYWINHTTGDANYLGFFQVPTVSGPGGGFGGGACTGSRTLSGTTTTADETFYCSLADDSTPTRNVIVSCSLTTTNQTGSLSIACTNITPAAGNKDLNSLITAYTASDTPSFTSSMFGCAISGKQNGKLMILCQRSVQDTIGWNVVFDPTLVSSAAGCVGGGAAGCVVAAMSTWAHAPARWCVNHTSFVSGPTDIVWTAGKFFLNFGNLGDGPYTSNVTSGSLASATGAIAPGVGLCPAGTLRCDTVTVDGEPCDQTASAGEAAASVCPKNSSWAYLQDAVVGDIFQINGDFSEWIVLANKSGNSWTFQRGYGFHGSTTHTGTSVSAFCSSQDFAQPYTNWSWTWDAATDPHGTNSGGTTIKVAWDYDHTTPFPTQTVGGDAFWDPGCTTTPCYAIRTTGSMGDGPNIWVSSGPKFAGAIGTAAYSVLAEDHPGWLQSEATAAEKVWLLDGRPLQPTQTEVSDAASNVSGQLYKFTSTTSDGDNLSAIGGGTLGVINRKLQPTWAYCGTTPLTDISSAAAGNQIGTTGTDAYRYCEARLAGECRTGSAQGDIYANCPSQVVRSGSGTYGCAGQDQNLTTDICIGNSSAYLNGIAQVGFAANDFTGALGRTLTNGLAHYKLIDGFWSGQAFADASWVLFRSMYIGGAWTGAMIGKLPPFPSTDSYTRSTFVPITVNISAGAQNNALVKFWYAESNGYCTSRAEDCYAVAATVPTIPFKFPTDGTSGTLATLAGLSCGSGCSVLVPGISQRVVYYAVVLRDASNAILSTGATQVAIVP